MKVNHEPKKVLIHGKLYECDRGQSLLSIESWVEEFGVNKWSRQRVRTFFNLLKDDQMINLEGMQKTTRLTVCNYEQYQDSQPAENQQTTNKQPTANQQLTTTKEGIKNDKKIIYMNGTKSKHFYDSEISANQSGSLIKQYEQVAEFILKQNVLPKVKHQLSYKSFATCYNKAKQYGYKISDYLRSMENWTEPKSGKSVAQCRPNMSLTLQTWMDNDAKRSGKIPK